MSRQSARSFLLVLMVWSLVQQGRAQDAVVLGYYPSWNAGTFPHTVVQYDKLTHIAHAFIFPYADGTLDVSTFSLYPDLVQSAHANGVKVLIAVGGWDAVRTPRYAQLAADTLARARFVANLAAFCTQNGYDGVDLDWEYPKTSADRSNLTLLVRELRTALDAEPEPMLLTMAVPAGWWGGQWYDFEAMKNDLDWVGMMTYDFYGAWTSKAGPNSALYVEPGNTEGWIENSVSYYRTTRGMPASKVLVGIPFYGQQFNASALYGASTGAVQITYKNIMPKLGQGWSLHRNEVGKYPYMINATSTQVITFDDSVSVSEKVAYAISKGLRGVMVWAIGQDEMEGRQPLLESLNDRFMQVTGIGASRGGALPVDPDLFQNYPNPFNTETIIRFRLDGPANIALDLFDILGRHHARLAEGLHPIGSHAVTLSSARLAAGTYFYRLTSGDHHLTRTLLVLP